MPTMSSEVYPQTNASHVVADAALQLGQLSRIGSPPQVGGRQTPNPTNRDRYENKPVPKLPNDSLQQFQAASQRPCIQPAIPLVEPVRTPKPRAVTDPLASKPLFPRRPSVSQLRRRMGHLKKSSAEEKQVDPIPTGKAAEVLGVVPIRGHHRRGPSSGSQGQIAGPRDATAGQNGCISDDNVGMDHAMALESQRYRRTDSEVTIDAKIANGNSPASFHDRTLVEQPQKTPAGEAESGSSCAKYLKVPKMPAYGKVGEKPALQDQTLVRVESVQGIIDHAELQDHGIQRNGPYGARPAAQMIGDGNGLVDQNGTNVQGIWENDPKVGYTLPPFSPAHHVSSKDRLGVGVPSPQIQNHIAQSSASWNASPGIPSPTPLDLPQRSSGSIYTFPDRFANDVRSPFQHSRVSYEAPINSGDQPAQLGSANSWANSPSRKSDISTNGPISALVPNRWPFRANNSVPSPPQTCPDYQRPDVLAASFSQLDLTIHHHLDKIFGHLTRMVADKSDRTLDQILGRLDTIEDSLAKNHKSLKHDLRHINTEVSKAKQMAGNSDSTIGSLCQQLGVLQAKIDIHQTHVESQLDSLRTLNRHGSDDSSPTSIQEQGHVARGVLTSGNISKGPDHNSRSLSRNRASRASSRSHRSNASVSHPGQNASDTRGTRWQFLDGLRLQEPDIKQHPAYAGIPQPPQTMCDQNGVPLPFNQASAQTLSESAWYQQAYGSH